MAAPAPEKPAQMAMARARSAGGKTLARIESVDGMTNAAPAPMSARVAISWFGFWAKVDSNDGDADGQQAELEGALATEAVTEGTGREQQPGEHDRVGVDDPLELGGRGAEVLLEGRQRHVEGAVADHDEHEAEAEHARGSPSAVGR